MVPVRWWKLVYSGGCRGGASGLWCFWSTVVESVVRVRRRAVVGGAGAGGVVFVVVLPCFDGVSLQWWCGSDDGGCGSGVVCCDMLGV